MQMCGEEKEKFLGFELTNYCWKVFLGSSSTSSCGSGSCFGELVFIANCLASKSRALEGKEILF